MNRSIKIILFAFLGLILLNAGSSFVFSQDKVLGLPGTLEEVKTQGSEFLRSFPGAVKNVVPQGLAVLRKVWQWLKSVWNSYFAPWFKNIWKETKSIIKQKKPEIQEELKKEKKEIKEEIKTDLPRAAEKGKSLWQRLKELIR